MCINLFLLLFSVFFYYLSNPFLLLPFFPGVFYFPQDEVSCPLVCIFSLLFVSKSPSHFSASSIMFRAVIHTSDLTNTIHSYHSRPLAQYLHLQSPPFSSPFLLSSSFRFSSFHPSLNSFPPSLTAVLPPFHPPSLPPSDSALKMSCSFGYYD